MIYLSARQLQATLSLTEDEVARMDAIAEEWPMRTTDHYLSLIDPDDPDDPIRRMSIPTIRETDRHGSLDTSGEQVSTVLPGLQHKYRQTAMILSTSECAMYCRYCFRKRLVGQDSKEVAVDKTAIVSYIRTHPEINNVLISGGDAFLNPIEDLREYLEALSSIEHLDYIRFGTRIPVVDPWRITEDPKLLELLGRSTKHKQIVIVTQYNHPRELNPLSIEAIQALQSVQLPVLNQTVLMRGVNDDPDTLAQLLSRLTAHGVVPYYVYQCRPVVGVMDQFQVPLIEGYYIVERAKAQQNGIGKSFRYCLSHEQGKIEVLGEPEPNKLLFKFHEAKHEADMGRVFLDPVAPDQAWL